MCSISVEPIPSTIRMPVFSNHASDTPAGSGSPADTHVCSESGRSSLEQRAVRGRRREQRRHPLRRAACRAAAAARSAPWTRRSSSGNSSEAPSPNVNAIGGEPLKTSAGCGLSTWRANVSHDASRSRWKCTQPLGSPVVPLVKAMIATSSAAVSHASNQPRRRQVLDHAHVHARRPRPPGRARRAPWSRSPWPTTLSISRAAQERHRGHDDPAREQDPEPARDRLRRVGRVQQHALARLDVQRARRRRPRARRSSA